MARPARFSDSDLLDAAAEVAAANGPAATTISAIAEAAGAPTGSLYHRFPSRDVLLGTLWLDLIGQFQARWIAALDADDIEAAALHTPNWVRAHPREARLLLLYRREDFLAGAWPSALADRAEHVNDRAAAALRAFAARSLGDEKPATLRRARFALVEIPYAAVRACVAAGQRPPPDLDALVLTASRAVLAAQGAAT